MTKPTQRVFASHASLTERQLIWLLSLIVILMTGLYAGAFLVKQQRDMRASIEQRGFALARGIAAIGSKAIQDNLFMLQSAITEKHRIEDVAGVVALDPDYMVVASDHPSLIGTTVTDSGLRQALNAHQEAALDGRHLEQASDRIIIIEPLLSEPENQTGHVKSSDEPLPSVERPLVGWIKIELSLNRLHREMVQLFLEQISFGVVLLIAMLFLIRKTVRRLSRDLRASEAQLGLAQRIAKIGNWEWDPTTDAVAVSPEFCRLIGVRPEDFAGTFQAFLEAVVPDDRAQVERELKRALGDEGLCDLDHRIRLPHGGDCAVHIQAEAVHDHARRTVTVIGTTQDISDRKRQEHEIHRLAYYDSLTGLPNRVLFKDRLTQAIAHANRYGGTLASMFLDLDRFKVINDTLGHNIGDLLLKAVADRLADCVRHSDSVARDNHADETSHVARLGGDEFTILLTNLRDVQDAATVARRILQELAKPFLLDNHEVFITTSIGIGVCPSDGTAADVLLKNADAAMYHAKEQGRNNFQFYAASMNATAAERMTLESDLRRGLERGELLVYYQPQIALRTNTLVGAEALVRWRHPQQGILSPPAFLPMAVETGLVRLIDEEVMRLACLQGNAWRASSYRPIRIAVNVSNSFFQREQLVKTVANGLRQTEFDPRCLELELTESIVMREVETSIQVLRALREMGVTLSIDDFGTGYSSLSYLQRLPLNLLKIDQSFVRDIAENEASSLITRAIISLAHSLNLTVLAEGVETEEQLTMLRELGCDEVQGYLFSRPVPAEEFAKQFLQGGSITRAA